MKQTTCPFCKENTPNAHESNLFIMDFTHGYLVLHNNQSYPGRCLYILNEHHENIWEIPDYVLNDINADLRLIGEVLVDSFDADLINISSLGNKVRHFHFHLIPRSQKDPNWGGPPWPNKEILLSPKQYNERRDKIKHQLKLHYAQ